MNQPTTKDFKPLKPSNLSKPSPFSNFQSNANTVSRMTFENSKNSQHSSPKDSVGISSPIGDLIKKANSKSKGTPSQSRSRERSPGDGSVRSKKSHKTSPMVSPMKKKIISDIVIDNEEEKNNNNEGNVEIKRFDTMPFGFKRIENNEKINSEEDRQ